MYYLPKCLQHFYIIYSFVSERKSSPQSPEVCWLDFGLLTPAVYNNKHYSSTRVPLDIFPPEGSYLGACGLLICLSDLSHQQRRQLRNREPINTWQKSRLKTKYRKKKVRFWNLTHNLVHLTRAENIPVTFKRNRTPPFSSKMRERGGGGGDISGIFFTPEHPRRRWLDGN